MAGETNTIEIVIKAVDAMSADLQKIQAQMNAMAAGTTQAARAANEASGHFTRLNQHLVPMRSLFFEVSNAARQMGPEFNTLGSVLDHMAARLLYVHQSGEGFGGVLAALATKGNLLVAAVVVVMTVLGALISRYKEVQKAAEEAAQAMSKLNSESRRLRQVEDNVG